MAPIRMASTTVANWLSAVMTMIGNCGSRALRWRNTSSPERSPRFKSRQTNTTPLRFDCKSSCPEDKSSGSYVVNVTHAPKSRSMNRSSSTTAILNDVVFIGGKPEFILLHRVQVQGTTRPMQIIAKWNGSPRWTTILRFIEPQGVVLL